MISFFLFSVLAIPYFFHPWWKFIPTTLVLLILSKFLVKNWSQTLGLVLPRGWVWLKTLLLLSTQLTVAYYLIPILALKKGIRYEEYTDSTLWMIGLLFQTLNEEMFFRAYLLNGLLKKGHSRWLVSIAPALFFAVTHTIVALLAQDLELKPECLFSLFLFGLVTNQLFLESGHIAYSFALHYGWNAIRFSGQFRDIQTQEVLNVWAPFNSIESSPWVMGCLILLLGLQFAFKGARHLSGRKGD